MTAEVHPLFEPDRAAMREHLEHMFGGYLDGCHDGLVELAWTSTTAEDGRYKLNHARLFGLDALDELVAEAHRLNSVPMCCVYVGAALRHPDTAPFARTEDNDAFALTCGYADLDEPGAATSALPIYGADKPTMVIVTGREPHVRAQMWWRLEEPLTDKERWPALLRGIAAKLHGDTTVTNPARVMRLAGSIAWPVKPGRHTELTSIARLREPVRHWYTPEHLEHVFPPIATTNGTGNFAGIHYTTNTFGLHDKIDNGREGYMVRTIAACLLEYIGTHGTIPAPQELFDSSWPQYERNVDLSNGRRGPEEFAKKCVYALQRFDRGAIKGMETLDKAIARYRAKASPQPLAPAEAKPIPPDDAGAFQASMLTGSPPPRLWVADDWIPADTVTSIYGDGGTGKTLIAQQLQYARSIGAKWLGLTIAKGASLGVYCEDDRDELHRRHDAIRQSLGVVIGNPFQDVWLWPRVGFDNLLVTFDRDSKPAMSPLFARIMATVLEHRIGLLVLDTAADLFGGNEIVRGQVNYFIKSVCGAYVRRARELEFSLSVVILAHPSQAGRSSGSGESGSTGWSNAVRSRLYLTKPDTGLPEQRILTRKKANYATAGDDVTLDLMWCQGVIVRQAEATSGDEGIAVHSAVTQILEKVRAAFERGSPYGGHKAFDNFLPRRMIAELPHVERRVLVAALDHIHRNQLIVVGKTPKDRRGYCVAESN